MSLKRAKEQLKALRSELGPTGQAERITVEVAEDMSDAAFAAWVSEAIGADWYRHWITAWHRLPAEAVPVIVSRDQGYTGAGGLVRLSAEDCALL